MVYKNYYKILGLETSHVSIDEIKLAYRAAAKKNHPDLNVGNNLSEEKIKDINEAYRILSVPSSKRKYDRIWNSHFSTAKKAFSGKDQKETILNMFLGNKQKSEEKMKSLIGGGTTVLFVSHSLEQIKKICNKVIWLEHGHIKKIGPSKEMCKEYYEEQVK